MKRFLACMFLLPLLLGLPGCERSQLSPDAAAPAAPVAARKLLQEPIEPALVELPSMAVAAWRQTGGKPALLLLANDPFLQPVPPELTATALELVASGSPAELTAFASYRRAAPRLLPFQSVRAALQNGLFSRLVWVFPTSDAEQTADLETFRRQLLEQQVLTSEEADKLRLEQGVFRGEMLGLPFQAGPLSAGQLPTERLQLHIDLSYFTPLYKDEVRTPVFEILRQCAWALAAANLQCAGASLSYSTNEGLLPLELRFLIANLSSLLQAPERLRAPLASPWKERGEALYLATFLQTDKVLEKSLQSLSSAPNDPAVHFDLYRSYRAAKKGLKALEHLALAVSLDHGYAMEYLALAASARDQKQPQQALEMLELARRSLPEDPFIPLQSLELQLEIGDKGAARPLVKALQGLPWSPVYFPGLPSRLQQLAEQAEQ